MQFLKPCLSGRSIMPVLLAAVWMSALAPCSRAVAQSEGVQKAGAGKLRPVAVGRIHFGDVIVVDVEGGEDEDWSGKLNADGEITGLPLYPDGVVALCKTPEELGVELEALFRKYLRQPKVTVRVADVAGRATASVSGAVKSPHRFLLKRPASLRELLVISGGLTETASGTVQIYRPGRLACTESPEDGGPASVASPGEFIEASIAELMKTGEEGWPQIGSGDVVTVLEALPVFALGALNRPGRFASRTETTLSRVIATAGGVTRKADVANVRIFRSFSGVNEVIEADLEKIAEGSSQDPVLKPFDVVEVSERGVKKSVAPPFVKADDSGRSGPSPVPLRILN